MSETIAWGLYGRACYIQRDKGIPYAEARIQAIHEHASRVAMMPLQARGMTYRDHVLWMSDCLDRLELQHELTGSRSGSRREKTTRPPN